MFSIIIYNLQYVAGGAVIGGPGAQMHTRARRQNQMQYIIYAYMNILCIFVPTNHGEKRVGAINSHPRATSMANPNRMIVCTPTLVETDFSRVIHYPE